MFHDPELTLKAAGRNDFVVAMCVGYLLVLFSALLSSNAVLLISVNFCYIFFSYHYLRQQGDRAETTSRIFRTNANGDLLLEQRSAGVIVGTLSGSQWCSRYMAILRYKSAGRTGHLVILKVRQRPEQFRQLSVWLRHNSRNEGRQGT